MNEFSYDADDTLSKLAIEELGLEPAPDGEVSDANIDQAMLGGANGE